MKWKINIFGTLIATALLSVTSLHAGVRIFSDSLLNQAGVSHNETLDTYDYITNPALFSLLAKNDISVNFIDINQLQIGGKVTLGIPFFLVVDAMHNSFYPGSGSTLTTDTTATTSADTQTFFKTVNNDYKIGLGALFGNFGVQLFADLAHSGTEGRYVNNDPTQTLGTGGLLNEDFKDFTSPYRLGANFGFATPEGVVVSLGAALSLKFTKSNFTETLKGGEVVTVDGGTTGAFASNAFFTAAGVAPTITNMLGGPLADPGLSTGNSTGLTVTSFGWIPLSGKTVKLGWNAMYNKSALDSSIYSVETKNSATLQDTTLTITYADTGFGTIVADPYVSFILPVGEKGVFIISPTVLFNIGSSIVSRTPDISGTDASGTTIAPKAIYDADTTGTASIWNVTSTQTDTLTYGLELPVIFKLDIAKDFTWIAGAKMAVQVFNSTTTTSIADSRSANDTASSTVKTDSGSSVTTPTSIATGFQWRASDNFNVNMLAGLSGTGFALANISLGADFFF